MDVFKFSIYLVCSLLAISMVCVVGMIAYTTADVLDLRSHPCENISVENTSYVATSSFIITINGTPRVVLDTANKDVIRKWGKMEPGDVISAKLGKTAVEFC
jgi:hypothetical protein